MGPPQTMGVVHDLAPRPAPTPAHATPPTGVAPQGAFDAFDNLFDRLPAPSLPAVQAPPGTTAQPPTQQVPSRTATLVRKREFVYECLSPPTLMLCF